MSFLERDVAYRNASCRTARQKDLSLYCDSSDVEELYEYGSCVLPYQFEPDSDDDEHYTAETDTDGADRELGLARLFTTDWVSTCVVGPVQLLN